MFPEEDGRRKYEMQETRLAATLLKVFGVSGAKGCGGEFLTKWPAGLGDSETEFECLGDGVRALLADVVNVSLC